MVNRLVCSVAVVADSNTRLLVSMRTSSVPMSTTRHAGEIADPLARDRF
jgi:hypothetical protein